MIDRNDILNSRYQFTMKYLPGVVFTRYPIAQTPEDGTVGFINSATRQTASVYRDGHWRDDRGRPVTWEPTHWTKMERLDGES